MDPDDLKLAWQQLGQRLEQQHDLQLDLLRERKRERMRLSLRPLFWGQLLQVGLGIALILLGVACWTRNPAPGGYFLAGALVHAFGVVTAACGGIVAGLLTGLDPAAPVLAIQKRIRLLRQVYGLAGIVVGWPWWIMWVPVTLALAGLGGGAVQAGTASWVWASLAVGAAGLLATWAFFLWARNPARPALAGWLERSTAGASLRKAQALLDELRTFERE